MELNKFIGKPFDAKIIEEITEEVADIFASNIEVSVTPEDDDTFFVNFSSHDPLIEFLACLTKKTEEEKNQFFESLSDCMVGDKDNV